MTVIPLLRHQRLRNAAPEPLGTETIRPRRSSLRPGLSRNAAPSRPHQRRCIIYIMRRTQLYLDDQLWGALHARAQSEKTSVSELVRQAVRERYLGDLDRRREAMQNFVGIRKA